MILLGHLISYNRYLTPSSFAPTTTTAIWVTLDFSVNLVYWMQTCSNRPLHRLRAMPDKEDWLCLLCVCDQNQYISSCIDFFFRFLLQHPLCFILISWLLRNTSWFHFCRMDPVKALLPQSYPFCWNSNQLWQNLTAITHLKIDYLIFLNKNQLRKQCIFIVQREYNKSIPNYKHDSLLCQKVT